MDKFLGAVESDKEVFDLAKKYYQEYSYEFTQEGTLQFPIPDFSIEDFEERLYFRIEEIMAMIIKYAKQLAQK